MNTETKHTPGPYAYDDGVVYAEHGLQVHVAYTKGLTDRPDANGRLFAAAPDLLAELKQAVARVDLANAEGNPILSAWLPGARAAIAKAEGQS